MTVLPLPGYPARNTPEWDIPLQDYIDATIERVRMMLPNGGGANHLESLGPLFAALGRRTTTPCRIATVGSSLVSGANASAADKRWVNVVAVRAQATYPSGTGSEVVTRLVADAAATPNNNPGVQVINAGITDARSNDYIPSSLLTSLNTVNADLVIHMVGSRDAVPGATYISPNAYQINVATALDSIDAQSNTGTPICHLLVHTLRPNGVTLIEWAEYGVRLRSLAEGRPNVAYLDISESFETVKHLTPDNYNVIDTDNLGLTDTGHAMMGYLISSALGFHGNPIPQSGGGGATASAVTFTPVGGVGSTNVQAAIAELDSEKLAKVDTFTTTLTTTLKRIDLNYALTTGSANIMELWLNGKLTAYFNEWLALRGTSPYTWGDALVRGIRMDGDGISNNNRCFIEIVDRRSGALTPDTKATMWGISWTGDTIRNGIVMNGLWVRNSPTTPIDPTLPSGTVVVTLPTGP